MEFSRENALLKQQIEFLNKKLDDANTLIRENQESYEERLCKAI